MLLNWHLINENIKRFVWYQTFYRKLTNQPQGCKLFYFLFFANLMSKYSPVLPYHLNFHIELHAISHLTVHDNTIEKLKTLFCIRVSYIIVIIIIPLTWLANYNVSLTIFTKTSNQFRFFKYTRTRFQYSFRTFSETKKMKLKCKLNNIDELQYNVTQKNVHPPTIK